jgi:hypothetical protein
MESSLTVDEVLTEPAGFDHEVTVKAVGPAVVLVLEREAPLRMELLASTDAEHQALREEARSNPRWGVILEGWIGSKDEENDLGCRREDDHVDRLERGARITDYRVTDH